MSEINQCFVPALFAASEVALQLDVNVVVAERRD
jgi:hypothetical protein